MPAARLLAHCLGPVLCTLLAAQISQGQESTHAKPAKKDGTLSEADLVEVGPPADPAYAKLFASLEITCESGGFIGRTFKYRLYEPNGDRPTNGCPLFIWLHGAGESGNDNVNQLRWLNGAMRFSPGTCDKHSCYMLALQCPKEQSSWYDASSPASGINSNSETDDDMLAILRKAIATTIEDYPIDEDRIYLSGISAGGTACWEMAARYPKLFAAVMPLAGGAYRGDVEPILTTPIWAFHNRFDDRFSVKVVEETVDRIKESRGKTALTIFDRYGHIANPFRDPYYLKWMLSKRRGQSRWHSPPGSKVGHWNTPYGSWKLSNLAWPIVAPLVIGLAVWLEFRRQQSAKACSGETDPDAMGD